MLYNNNNNNNNLHQNQGHEQRMWLWSVLRAGWITIWCASKPQARWRPTKSTRTIWTQYRKWKFLSVITNRFREAVLLRKQVVPLLFKKFSALGGNLFSPVPDQSSPCPPILQHEDPLQYSPHTYAHVHKYVNKTIIYSESHSCLLASLIMV